MVQLFIQTEAAHDTVDELGKLGLIEFVDVSRLIASSRSSHDSVALCLHVCSRHSFCTLTLMFLRS